MYILFRFLYLLFLSFDGARNETEVESSLNCFDNGGLFDSFNNVTTFEELPKICDDYSSEFCAKTFLENADCVLKRNGNRIANVEYQYFANITDDNGKWKTRFNTQYEQQFLKAKEEFSKFNWRRFESPRIKRLFELLTADIQSKNETISVMLVHISTEIQRIYNKGQPCFGTCLKPGEVEIINYFKRERNYEKLAGFWTAWRNVTGRQIKPLYVKRLVLENIGAKENGYSDAVAFELWKGFEETNFNDTVVRLYEEILPFYKELHGFVRYCLAKFYPDKFNKTGPIPAHILGNVWAQEWHNIMDIIRMCRGNVSVYYIQDEANIKLSKKSTKEMFEIADEFYASIGMYNMTPTFWKRSVVEQLPGRLIDCHGSAYDFYNGEDYRIMMCTLPNLNDFTTIHHEIGHIQYYMAYKTLPYAFQGGANLGFHEAIGDTIALSVMTPAHLQKISLITSVDSSPEFDIEYLLATALEKVAFLPFALTMDSYSWSVYNGSVPLHQLNSHWWNLRYRFQGVAPPVQRSEDDFDPAAKYHMAFGISYIRYFISFIQQFQFYEAMCKLSGNNGALHKCDFYGSKAAGTQMLKMLKKGQSQHWRESLKILTGTQDITSTPLLRYFKPLIQWLKDTNSKLKVPVGW